MRAVVSEPRGSWGHICATTFSQKVIEVLAVDNLLTGVERNLTLHLIHTSISDCRNVTASFEDDPKSISFFTCFSRQAPDYLMYRCETLDVGSLGTRQMLGMSAEEAPFLLYSPSIDACREEPTSSVSIGTSVVRGLRRSHVKNEIDFGFDLERSRHVCNLKSKCG